MNSTSMFAKDVLSKGEGLERENVKCDLDPIENIQDVWKLKQTQLKRVVFPTMDSPPISPYIELRRSAKGLEHTEEHLKKKRRDLIIMKKYLRSEWLDLSMKERSLKENFIIFSKFLKTNLEKRERAIKKIQTDTALFHFRTLEIDQLKQKYDTKFREFQLMKSEIEKHSIYGNFLGQVVSLSNGEFKDMEDLPKRMDVLFIAKERLRNHQADQLSYLEKSKRKMAQFMESKLLHILGLNNTLATLQYYYDDAVNRAIELDNMVVHLKATVIKYSADVYSNRDGIRNLYRQMCKKHRLIEKHRKKDVTSQLMEINRAMIGYKKVQDLVKRKSSRGSKAKKSLKF